MNFEVTQLKFNAHVRIMHMHIGYMLISHDISLSELFNFTEQMMKPIYSINLK